MEERKLTVLVTGATGKQGGAVARALLANGHRVRALTRSPESVAAKELERLGADLVTGDFNNPVSLERAVKEMDAVFAMSTPYEGGPDLETRQGIALADAAKAAAVRHFIYTSVAAADRSTGIPFFDSKVPVEQHIRGLGIPYTILGPVFFMDNFLGPTWLPDLKKGRLTIALPADRPLQQIAVSDIGHFAALVAENRDKCLGKRIELASDELTPKQVCASLTRACGKEITYSEVPMRDLRESNPGYAKLFEWFDRTGYNVDIAALRRDYPSVGWHTFAQWAKEQDLSALR
ncbi:MAG: NmrA/HSCARG family protein [Candidatus Riflebacteria bacterium]|nr:NmrA/HSCARG family protein [Candidatus Riflebacteria bacterium]